jgi:tetratricopeptide (TPR) repeat protein
VQWERGNIQFNQGLFEEAIASYREAIRLKPDFPEAHSSLGIALAADGYYKEAEAACRKAIELKPDSGQAHVNLGLVLARNFHYKEAEAAFRDAIQLQPGDALAVCNLGIALQNQGRLADALEELRRGDAMGRQIAGWRQPSAQWVRQCERIIELDGKLPAVLAGDAEPAGAVECLELVNLCVIQKRLTVAAVRFAAQTSADDAQLTDDQRFIRFYNGACGAALAAGGQGEDARRLPDKVVVMLRGQALRWLRSELAEQAQVAELNDAARKAVRRQMRHWQQDPDLVAVRDPQALGALPEEEQKEWRRLWADVEALLKKAAAPQ